MLAVELRCPSCGKVTAGLGTKIRWRFGMVSPCQACGEVLPRGGNLIAAAVMTPCMFLVGLAFVLFGVVGAIVTLIASIAVAETAVVLIAQPARRRSR